MASRNIDVLAGSISSTELADDAVTTDKIVDEAVSQSKLGTIVVTRKVDLNALGVTADLTRLPSAGDGTSLGLVAGTYGTAAAKLSGSAANNNSKTETARGTLVLPSNYVAAGDVTVRIRCRVDGTAAVAQTVDLSARLVGADGAIGADIVETDAQTIPNVWDDVDFVITGTSLTPGAMLELLITTVVNDTGGTLNKAAEVASISLVSIERVS